MPLLPDSPLLARSSVLDKPAVVGPAHVWTWRQIHEAAVTFSCQLGDASAVLNLCTFRVAFLVTWLAALRSGAELILPPSRGLGDLASVVKASTGRVVAVDDPQAASRWRQDCERLICRPEWMGPSGASDSELAWHPAWDANAVRLYTSGSTGVPEPQQKTLRHLVNGATLLGERLARDIDGGLAAIERIVCSVPQQHMFGFETSVMLSLVHAIPVLERRPLLPADVQEAFADGPPGAWIATPLHLRALALAGDRLTHCRAVVTSTMPLTQTLAQQTEDLSRATVLEIYGSTETGVLATRRTANAAPWHLVDGVRFESSAQSTRAWGSHFASPVSLPDLIDIDSERSFTLLGRQTDLIKIAGRRASLAGLNLLLQDLPGLDDAVFHLPATDNPAERLCLIHQGPAPERSEIERWLRPRLDPVFLPRTLIRVDRLPRSDSGKLQRQALDRLYAEWQASASASATNEFRFAIPAAHPSLEGHFPGRPIVPGVLLLDEVLTHLGTTLPWRPLSLQQVKFTAFLLPGETARAIFDIGDRRVTFSVETLRDGRPVLLASGTVSTGRSLEAAG